METVKEVNTVNKDFRAIAKQVVKLSTLTDKSKETEYYANRDVLIKMLQNFLRTEFTTLSKESFLMLCDLVSTYRPVQPFSFLVSISLRKS